MILDNGTVYTITELSNGDAYINFLAINSERVKLRKLFVDGWVQLVNSNSKIDREFSKMFDFMNAPKEERGPDTIFQWDLVSNNGRVQIGSTNLNDKVDKDAKCKWDICDDDNVSCKIEIIDYGKTRK